MRLAGSGQESSPMTRRIALYWHNGRSLGHTVRCATLGEALLGHIPDSIVVGITGASKGFELLPPGMHLVKIPSYLTYDNVSGVRTTPVLPLGKEEFERISENLVATFIRDFQAHAFGIDFSPEGKSGELIPTVTGSPNVKKVLGLRGMLGSPEETNREFFNARLVAFVQEYFSAINVYVDERVLRLEEYYAIPASLSSMLKYTGYVTPPPAPTKAEARAMLRLVPRPHLIGVYLVG